MKKILVSTAILLTMYLGVNAQSYVAPVGSESIDSVTVGSRMGYQVTPDATIAAMTTIMDASVFKWSFSNSATVLKQDGTAATAAPASLPGYITESGISAVMPASAGTLTLSATERSVPKAGVTLGCDGNTQTLNIQVLPRATVNFVAPLANGACSAQNYSLPLSLTGYGPWTVTYTISYNSGAAASYTTTVGAVTNKPGTTPLSTLTLDIPSAQLSSGVGTYTVNVTNIVDRIAGKSLDQTLVAASASDLPTAPFNLYIYPTPATNPIQHIRNL